MAHYLTQLLHRHAQCHPDVTAVVCEGTRLNYAQLRDRAARMGAILRALGVGPGDRVALLSHHCVQATTLMFGCWWIGAVFCPQNTRWSEAELADALNDCEPTVLLHDAAHAALAQNLAGRAASVRHLRSLESPLDDAPVEDTRTDGATLAALIYTGGTTGRSKGVMLSHACLSAAALSRMADLDSLEGSVAMVLTPNFHVASLIRGLTHWIAGSTVALLPKFDPRETIELIEREQVTDVPFVPTMLQMVLDHPDFEPSRMRSVKRLSYGAAPSAQALLQRAQAVLPWAGLYQYYGMTESCGVATLSTPGDHRPEDWASGRAGSAGRAGAVTELRIADESGHDVPVGQVGEILLRGPLVSPGYWRRPEETARTFGDGWLHTGDAGRLDEHGYLYVVDRIKDMIVTGGENVYSAEVENALARHHAVAACAVIGVPHERWGEAVHAVVVLRAGRTVQDEELRAHCRQAVADYKVPKTVEFRAELPLTPAGKIAKNVLREKFWTGRSRQVA